MELEQAPKHYASEHGGNTALELFKLPPTDTRVLSGRWQSYHPESRIQRGSPIEFNIETTHDYIDLSKCYLKVKLKVTKANGDDRFGCKEMHSGQQFHAQHHQTDVHQAQQYLGHSAK